MNCPHCQRTNIPDSSTHCPHCAGALDPQKPPVIDAELVNDSRPSASDSREGFGQNAGWQVNQQSYQKGQRYNRVFYTSFPGNGQTEGLSQSCVVTVVMLALTLGAGFQYGFLAALGFLVFAGIGRAVTFVVFMRRLLEGRHINPWLLHGTTWFICWLLVAWLSGGLD